MVCQEKKGSIRVIFMSSRFSTDHYCISVCTVYLATFIWVNWSLIPLQNISRSITKKCWTKNDYSNCTRMVIVDHWIVDYIEMYNNFLFLFYYFKSKQAMLRKVRSHKFSHIMNSLFKFNRIFHINNENSRK